MGDSVPDSWDQSILGNYCDIKGGKRLPKGRPFSASRTNYPYVRVSDFSHGSISFQDLKFVDEDTRDQIARYTISSSDLYISIAGTLGLVGSVPSKLDGALLTENAAKIIFRDREKSDKYFFKYLLNSDNCQRHFNSEKGTGGGVPKLALFRIEDTEISVPPLPEQKKIATILTSVDTVIEKTQAQIDKLNDLKTGMMQELLTKGIGPDGKPHTEFKDSPVGRIPVGWSVAPMNDIANVVDSLHLTPTFSESGFPMVRVSDIKQGILSLEKCEFVDHEVFQQFTSNHKPQKGNLILSRVGSYGNCAYVDTNAEFCIGQNTVVIIPNKVDDKFLFYALSSSLVKNQIEFEVAGSGYKSLSLSSIRRLQFLIPSPIEQNFIAKQLWHMDRCIFRMKRKLSKISHLKKALMQDLLTGKVRVTPDPE